MSALAEDEPAAPDAVATARLAMRDAAIVVATFLLMFVGVGHLSAQAGLSAPQTALMTLLTLAAPAQVAAVELLAGGAWLSAILAAAIVNLRFMVMIAAVAARLPPFPANARGRLALAASLGLISASSFAVVITRLNATRLARPALYTGLVGAVCALAALVGATVGHAVGAALPPALSTALTLMVPLYFATLILRARADRPLLAAALAGGLAIPALGLAIGNLALLVGGVGIGAGVMALERLAAGRRG